ncbi:MAG: hypothetical protein ACOX5W_02305 [Bacillota bacterium]|mgnify:CR=1 FL=1
MKKKETKNIAVKCNWNDAGYKWICSDAAYRYNIKNKNKWCSNEYCGCREFVEFDKFAFPCFDSVIFRDYCVRISGSPWRIKNTEEGKIALLTTRDPDCIEEDRFIFGFLYIEDLYETDENGYLCTEVYGNKNKSLKIDDHIMRYMKFWDYYENANSYKMHWGSGLFRYVENVAIYRFLCDLEENYEKYEGDKAVLPIIKELIQEYRGYYVDEC